MKGAQFAVQMFLVVLAGRGLAPDALDPWRGWVAFKQYARAAEGIPEPGVSVQVTHDEEGGTTKLFFVRQAVEQDDDWLDPIGGVVCEFTFPLPRTRAADWELWSFDYSSFERFVDVVEQQPEFADLVVKRPLRSAVYWEDA